MSETMRAARVARHGGVEVIELVDLPRPTPGPGEVLVEIRASGLNHLDLWVRRGVPGHEYPLPLIPGSDGAGIVRELGEGVTSTEVGAEVILAPGVSCGSCEECQRGRDHFCPQYGILGETRDGTSAEYACVPAANVIPKPPEVDFPEAGCFALVALTSWTMLVDRAALRSGETVLVLAGGSGVGSVAIQIARRFGARVLATAGGPEKCRRLEALSPDAVIDHASGSILDRVRELTDGRGVDVVFEHVGAATWKSSFRALAPGGRLVTCGATTGPIGEVHIPLLFWKNLSILGSTMGPRDTVSRVVEELASGHLTSTVGEVLPLADIHRAHELLEERAVFGKVVLTP